MLGLQTIEAEAAKSADMPSERYTKVNVTRIVDQFGNDKGFLKGCDSNTGRKPADDWLARKSRPHRFGSGKSKHLRRSASAVALIRHCPLSVRYQFVPGPAS